MLSHTTVAIFIAAIDASRMPRFQTPPSLSRGDQVLVIAPSSGGAASARHVFELGVRRLADVFDLDVVVHPTARQSDEFLRGHPRARAAAIHEGFRDPTVGAVFATIGGDDQLRVLKHIDPDVLQANPTRFFGMSDNTNLQTLLWNQGIISYYGGQLLNQIATPGRVHPYTVRYLERALFEDEIGPLEPAGEWADTTVGWEREDYASAEYDYVDLPEWTWAGGDNPAVGRVWGGCLEVLAWQLMTGRYLPGPADLDGAILAIETSEELPSADRVGRVLMSMGERGMLQRFGGVLVGRPATQNWRESRPMDERHQYREEQCAAILTQLERYNPEAPVVFDLDFGHTDPTLPLPIGGRLRIEPAHGIVHEEK